jgi:hypothetical protein
LLITPVFLEAGRRGKYAGNDDEQQRNMFSLASKKHQQLMKSEERS